MKPAVHLDIRINTCDIYILVSVLSMVVIFWLCESDAALMVPRDVRIGVREVSKHVERYVLSSEARLSRFLSSSCTRLAVVSGSAILAAGAA